MPLLNTVQVAALFGLSDRRIRQLAAAGVITGVRIGRRGNWKFSEDYIKSLVAGAASHSTSNEVATGNSPVTEGNYKP